MKEDTDLRDSLGALAEDVAEAASYLRELGVEGLEGATGFAAREVSSAEDRPARPSSRAAAASTPVRSSALERHARAEETKQPPMPAASTPPKTLNVPSPPPSRINLPPPPGSSSTSVLYQTAMPTKKPVRRPSANPPEPRETLFGEIKPKDELSLGREGETFQDIRDDIGECVRCPLHEGRTKIVHTEGNQKARLMFVGEAPGADEDASGRPFVGRAGQLLNKIIEAIGLTREDILIGNVNRCRPPGNRTPTTEEAKTCKPFLLREIAIARPDVIVVLGNTAMKNLLDTKEGITRLRGQFQDYKGIKVMPTFHPAYLLRDPTKKREVWEDMKKVRAYLNEK
ncbi:MAG TPA: uracil-DNA glycosylase [Pyrinomonadaceae bacterium]|nr:uracil-DNA glycosylase [Pyrinomonadaceae bacterium]